MLEGLITKAAFAWDPISQIRDRLASGNLNVGAVLAACIGVIIASNLASIASRKVFFDSLSKVTGAKYGDHPVVSSKIAQEFLTILSVAPVALLALLPNVVFYPTGKSIVLATFLIVLASVGFYSSIMSIVVNISASIATTVNAIRGLWILTVGSGIAGIATIGYFVVIWIRAASVIGIGMWSSTILLSAFLAALALVLLLLRGLTGRGSRFV